MSQILATQDSVAVSTDNPLPVRLSNADVVQPIQIDSHKSQTIQTHNAVSVALSGFSAQTNWMDCDGYTDLAITAINDAVVNSSISVWWSNDGSTTHGNEVVIASNTTQQKAGLVPIKARYAKVVLSNGDAGLAHTMSAWAFLKS